MKLALFAIALLAAWPQTANVIEITTTDASRVKSAWTMLQKAQADWDAVSSEMEKKYVNVGPEGLALNPATGKGYLQPLKGFEYGFEFSKDFRFIVPKHPEEKSYISPFYMSPARSMNQ